MISIFDSDNFNANLFFPRKDSAISNIETDEIFVEVDKKFKVHVRRHPYSNAKFSLLFFHGNGEIVSDYDNLAQHFSSLFCEFIVCDFRGYGKSDGKPTLRNINEDASTIYKYLKLNKKLKPKVCVMGRSIGSSPAIDLCIKFSEICCCIIESGFADPIALVERRGIHINHITSEENKLFNNSEKIRRIKCPILLMHGEDDFIVNLQEARVNYKNAGSQNKVLDIFKGVGHNNIMLAKGNAYFNSINNFVNSIFLR